MMTVALDDVATWPPVFRSLVEATAARSGDDEWFEPTSDGLGVQALSGTRVRVYHCTRLTPREVASVQSEGLQPLSIEFTHQRVRAAVLDGHLTEEEGAFYGQTALPREKNRAGMVWFFTDRVSLAKAPQIGYLVEVWGGEGINMTLSSRSPEMRRLEGVGTPSVVVAAIDLDRHYDYAHPGVLAAAVRQLRCGEGGTSVMCRSAVEAQYIESIEHPGGEFWDRHVWTPRDGFRSNDA
jgi:hypothetical protein